MVFGIKFPKINLSVKLLFIVVLALLFGQYLPEKMQSLLYAISLTLKGSLLFLLPAVIFSCLFACLLAFRGGKAIGFMLVLFAIVCASNFISTFIAYLVGSSPLLNYSNITLHTIQSTEELTPLWNIEFPIWLSNDYALYLGFIAGAIFSLFPSALAYQFSLRAKQFVTLFLEKGFIPVLPIFALGFILKMQHDGILTQIIKSYLPLLALIILTYLVYLAFLFAVAAQFNLSLWLRYIKNVIPVAITGFSTMSSLATMPMTLKAAEKNTGNVDLARIIIPATVNIHMVGACIAIPIMAFSILSSFGHEFPSFAVYLKFAFYSVLAQTAVVAVPGGGILVKLPILESQLGFTGEMSALITALFILFDPAVTITNVLGNSAFVIFISKMFSRLFIKANLAQETAASK